MKKIRIFALSVLLAFAFTAGAYAEGLKVATLDLSRTFDEYIKTKEFDAVLSDKTEAYKKEREKKMAELDELKGKLALLKEDEKDTMQKDLEKKSEDFFAYDQAQQTDLRKERDEKVREILLEIEGVVNDYAKKQKYDLILNDRVLIYGDETLDVTDDILKSLNDSYNKKTDKTKTEK